MNKQEQIEEMAKIIDELYNVYDTTAGEIAEGLYNAGYRKVPFDIRHCFNEIERKMKFKTDFGIIDFTEEQILFIEQAIYWEEKKARKKTAKEILLLLGKGYDETEKTEFNNLQWYKEFCRELKHRYGVEVEE